MATPEPEEIVFGGTGGGAVTDLAAYLDAGGFSVLERARGMTPDEVTLRTVECAGGCGWGTVVAVDHRYREPVRAGDVSAIVKELRGAD